MRCSFLFSVLSIDLQVRTAVCIFGSATVTNLDLAIPSRGYSTDPSEFYKILLSEQLVGLVIQNFFCNKSGSPYTVLVSIIFGV